MRFRRSRGAGDTPVAEQLSLLDTTTDRAPKAGPSGESRRRVAIGRRSSAVALAVAAALAGSITTSRTGMLASMTGDKDEATDTSELGGFLPVEMDEADLELAAFEDPELLEAVPVGEEEVSDDVEEVLEGDEVIEALDESGIPKVAIDAYNEAADVQEDADPECGIRWSLLAAIGRVESNHGRFGGAKLREDGYGTKPIRGIPLDGRENVALIRDSDGGRLDGDKTFDRAVGPMQFIPTTWRSVGQDGNGDGNEDPNNIYDAAQGAGAYLCAGEGDLTNLTSQAKAVRRYNNAASYVRLVMRLAMMYETGEVRPLPDLPIPPAVATPSAPRPRPTPTTSTPAAPAPTTPAPTTPAPTSTTTVPPTTTTTVPPTSAPAVTTPTTTSPDTTSTTVVTEPTPEPTPGAPTTPPAAVGWAPAMREVVIDILTGEPCDPEVVPADDADADVDEAAQAPEPEECLPAEDPAAEDETEEDPSADGAP